MATCLGESIQCTEMFISEARAEGYRTLRGGHGTGLKGEEAEDWGGSTAATGAIGRLCDVLGGWEGCNVLRVWFLPMP